MDRNDPFLAQASALPAMPEVAQQLLRTLDRDDVAIGDVAALVARDPAIAAKVLRLANSARYAPSRSIDTLADAAHCLGLRTLRDLSLSAALAGALPHPAGLDRPAFWRLSLATGGYAQVLAQALDADPEVAYLGGMMLRLGQLLMALAMPERLAEVRSRATVVDSRIGYDQACLGRAYPQVTAALARHWQFPPALCEAFDAATAPMDARPFSRLGAVLRLAAVVAESRERHEPVAESLSALHGGLVAHLQLDLTWLDAHLPEHAMVTGGAEALLG